VCECVSLSVCVCVCVLRAKETKSSHSKHDITDNFPYVLVWRWLFEIMTYKTVMLIAKLFNACDRDSMRCIVNYHDTLMYKKKFIHIMVSITACVYCQTKN
jgi:hypothetical protein